LIPLASVAETSITKFLEARSEGIGNLKVV